MSAGRLLFKKGMIDLILYLDRAGSAGYYSLYKQNFVVSRETFSNVLRELEGLGLVNREVVDGRPPRVKYSLTEKGRLVAKLLRELDRVLRGE